MKIQTVFLIFLLLPSIVTASLLDKANELFKAGKTLEAIDAYRQAALGGENPALCYFNMANAYYQIDSLPQCIVYYKACLGYAPDYFRAHLNLAIAYYSLDDIGACVAAINRALSIKADDQKALSILSASYRKAGAYPEAVATFERLVTSYPDHEEAYIALAEMYRELEDPDAAINWLLKYPGAGRNESYVQVLLADIFESENDLEKALYYLQQSYEKDSSNKWVFYRIVLLHQKMGNTMVALEQAKRGVELMPDFAELSLFAGNLAFQLEKYEEAERYYTIARNNGSAGAVVGLENIRVIRTHYAENE